MEGNVGLAAPLNALHRGPYIDVSMNTRSVRNANPSPLLLAKPAPQSCLARSVSDCTSQMLNDGA